MKYKYRYQGATDVNLPTHGIFAKGEDDKTVYETDKPIHHPDFVQVAEAQKESK